MAGAALLAHVQRVPNPAALTAARWGLLAALGGGQRAVCGSRARFPASGPASGLTGASAALAKGPAVVSKGDDRDGGEWVDLDEEMGYNWERKCNIVTSVRPSVLSPLHAAYLENKEIAAKKAYVLDCLIAQMRIANEVSLESFEDVAPVYRERLEKLAALTDHFRQLSQQGEVPPPAHPWEAVEYLTVLQQSAARGDPHFEEFHDVAEGRKSVLTYWMENFANRYKHSPQLPSLVDIYSRDAAADAELRKRKAALAALAGRADPSQERWPQHDVGRRKTSVARVLITPGTGAVTVNGRALDVYFADLFVRQKALEPLFVCGVAERCDVRAYVQGGGASGQAQALRHGLARALSQVSQRFGPALKAVDLLRRDVRSVERKKPGKAKARKSFTWVKR